MCVCLCVCVKIKYYLAIICVMISWQKKKKLVKAKLLKLAEKNTAWDIYNETLCHFSAIHIMTQLHSQCLHNNTYYVRASYTSACSFKRLMNDKFYISRIFSGLVWGTTWKYRKYFIPFCFMNIYLL